MMTNSFWALIALIIFCLILVYYHVPAMLKKALNKRAERIAQELEEARRLREEAQQLLAEYQKKRFSAEQEAAEIIASARRQAEIMTADIKQQTEDYIARRNKMAEQRIARAEIEAVDRIRAAAVDKAVAAAGAIMTATMTSDKAAGERLFQQSLQAAENALKKFA